MNLYEIIKHIQDIAEIGHINSSFIGDIYELNHRQDIEYPAFVITQGTHSYNNDEETNIYNLSLFFVDRLTEDKSNELDVQNWAVTSIENVIKTMEKSDISTKITTNEISPFTERFNSLCAGAYGTLLITMDDDVCCNKPRFVTSVNGQTGDVYLPEVEGVSKGEFEIYKEETASTIEDIKESIPTIPSFKTINGEEITGEGDIEIKGGDVTREEFDDYKEQTNGQITSLNNEIGEKADKSEIPDVSNLATKDELAEKADKSQIPDVSNLATKDELSEKADKSEITDKQDVLVSGENIKTINGQSILGEGNIEIQGGEGDVTREEFDEYKSEVASTFASKMDYVEPTFKINKSVFYEGMKLATNSMGYALKSLCESGEGSSSNNVRERYHSTQKLAVNHLVSNFIRNYIEFDEEGNATVKHRYMYVKGGVRVDKGYVDAKEIFYDMWVYGSSWEDICNISDALVDKKVYGNQYECTDYTTTVTPIIDKRDTYCIYAAPNNLFSSNFTKIGIGEFSCPSDRQTLAIMFTHTSYPFQLTPYLTNCIDMQVFWNILKENIPNEGDYDLWLKLTNERYHFQVNCIAPDAQHYWLFMSDYLFFGDFIIEKPEVDSAIYNLGYNLNNKPNKSDIATINGQSIINGGNIEIQGGGDVTREEFDQLEAKVDNIELVKSPNVTIFGTPTIQNGQISNFSNDNYAQFPFLLDIGGRPYDIRFSFTTGDSVEGQQNILDSNYGIALAVRNGVLVFNASNNGYEWTGEDGQEIIVYENIQPDTTYYIRIVRTEPDINYFNIYLYSDRFETQIADRFVWFLNFYPRQILIGRSYADNVNHFTGSLNLNDASISINNELMWQGMDDVGLSTRLSTDMANLDSAGELVINKLIAGIFVFDEETGVLNITTV